MELKMKDIMSEQEWKASGLTCLAARPAMGKTALAIELALDAARWMEKKIVWFSLEMNEKKPDPPVRKQGRGWGGRITKH